MATLTYNPRVFDVPNERAAREIILTTEGGIRTDERWVRETPHLVDLIATTIKPHKGELVVDFGCGIGRLSKELIARFGCRVLGVDISQDMRSLAPAYVGSPEFSVVSPAVFAALVAAGLKVDAALAVWVLQHCLAPAADLDLLCKALGPRGRVFVVNNKGRAVPTIEAAWASDGINVRALLKERLAEKSSGALDPTVVTDFLSDNTFWAAYAA